MQNLLTISWRIASSIRVLTTVLVSPFVMFFQPVLTPRYLEVSAANCGGQEVSLKDASGKVYARGGPIVIHGAVEVDAAQLTSLALLSRAAPHAASLLGEEAEEHEEFERVERAAESRERKAPPHARTPDSKKLSRR